MTPGTAADTRNAVLNDLDSVRETFEACEGDVACVIVEPVAGNMGCVPPEPGFLEGLREICSREGALLLNDAVQGYEAPAAGYYSVAAASVGLQAGLQTSSHVLFFMTDEGLNNFRASDGWEVGADAEITFPDAGLNAQVNTTLLEKPVIGYVFGQDGVLIGASLEGAKYSPIVR